MLRRNQQFTKFWIRSYGPSNTANDLAELLDGKVLRHKGSVYRKKKGHVLINWGGTAEGLHFDLNQPGRVARAVSKLATFKALEEAGVPSSNYTTDQKVANVWLKHFKVLGRDSDTGHGGQGIKVYRKGEEVDLHKFYVAYFKKEREFRVHVFGGKIIFEQEKLKKNGVEADKYIRSHDRGWCFAFNHLNDKPVPEAVRAAAVESIKVLGLDFGAVDCGWNQKDGACVFEVNTAPGLEESSLQAYAKALKEI